MKIYEILPNRYLGEVRDVPDGTMGIPAGNTRTIAPEIPEGMYCVWEGTYWRLTDIPPPIPQEIIPEVIIPTISMRQARLALLGAGLLSQVNAAVAQLDETAKIEWEYASEVKRDAPLVVGLAQALNLTDQQLDELFILASNI